VESRVVRPLTPRQMDILKWIILYDDLNPTPPSQAEIARAFSISQQAVSKHLKAIEKRGYITIDTRMARGIYLEPAIEDISI
jgi:DNA-binding MarR family transcriptional regulator